MSDEQTTGTTAQDGGEAQAPGTPDAADGNAQVAELEALRAFKQQALAEKQTLEKTKQELAELKARQQQPPTNGAGDPVAERITRLDALIAKNRAYAAQGDDTAALALESLELQRYQIEKLAYTERQIRDEAYLLTLPEDVRDEVRSEYQSGNYRSPEAAKWAVFGKKSAASQADLQQKQAEIERERQVRATGEKAGAPRPMMGEGTKVPVISEDEYVRRVEAGDVELFRAVENQKMKVKWT